VPTALDPSTATGTIILGILATVCATALLAVLAWLAGPLKWPFQNHRLRKIILSNRDFRFVFNPEVNKAENITFLTNGQIGKGQNSNEHSWQIRRGKLEILATDGKWYSRFSLEPKTGKLTNTNELGTRSVHGQYFVPQWEQHSPNSLTTPKS